jgi:CHAT domain-containing protein
MAGRTRLSVIDAMALPLEKTQMVVLSACESGFGSDGLEYATLSRAFAYAGATAVVATLWRVNDAASSALIEEFYRNLQARQSIFLALANAQRALIQRGGAFASPAAWSGFVTFGRP